MCFLAECRELDFDTAQNMLRMVSELPDGFEMTGMERLNQMLKLINQGTYIQVEDLRRKTIPLDREERGFHVR